MEPISCWHCDIVSTMVMCMCVCVCCLMCFCLSLSSGFILLVKCHFIYLYLYYTDDKILSIFFPHIYCLMKKFFSMLKSQFLFSIQWNMVWCLEKKTIINFSSSSIFIVIIMIIIELNFFLFATIVKIPFWNHFFFWFKNRHNNAVPFIDDSSFTLHSLYHQFIGNIFRLIYSLTPIKK